MSKEPQFFDALHHQISTYPWYRKEQEKEKKKSTVKLAIIHSAPIAEKIDTISIAIDNCRPSAIVAVSDNVSRGTSIFILGE